MWAFALLFLVVLLAALAIAYFGKSRDSNAILASMIKRDGESLIFEGNTDIPHPERSAYAPPSKICIVSGSIWDRGKREYSLLSRQCLEDYARRHGYETFYFDKYLVQVPSIWQKVIAVDLALGCGYDVVVWIDDDIYLTRPDMRIEEFLSMSEKNIILSEDIRDSDSKFINTGIYILRNTQTSRDFIKDTLDGRLGLFSGEWNTGCFHEQSVMTYLALTKYKKDVAVLKKGVLQSYSVDNSWKCGDFSCHMAGETRETRNLLMSMFNGKFYSP